MAYATLEDLRDFGVAEGDASDARCNRALVRAQRSIDSYTGIDVLGMSFDEARDMTITVDGIYKGTVPLPSPFSDITAVTVDGIALSEDQFQLRRFGLALFGVRIRDADGFPLTWSATRAYPRIASTVEVTGTFGSDEVDPTIVEAAIILASGFARLHADDALAPAVVRSTNAGGTYVAQGRTDGATTGNLEVDAMLDSFIYAGGMVD